MDGEQLKYDGLSLLAQWRPTSSYVTYELVGRHLSIVTITMSIATMSIAITMSIHTPTTATLLFYQ